MTAGKSDKKLGYSFVPIPIWVEDEWERGGLSDEARDILCALFRRANLEILKKRDETPKLRIESLAAAVHRSHDPASLEGLRRLLRKYRSDGLLGFRTEGTGTRTVYVFQLFPDDRRHSAVVPPSQRVAVPPSRVRAARSVSATGASAQDSRSAVARDAGPAAVPRDAAPVPPSGSGATPLRERDRGEVATVALPGALDVLENTYNPPRANLHLEASAVDAAHADAREPDGDLLARIEAAREAQHRETRALTHAWVATLRDEPRPIDGISERALVADLFEELDAVLVDDDRDTAT